MGADEVLLLAVAGGIYACVVIGLVCVWVVVREWAGWALGVIEGWVWRIGPPQNRP